MVPDEVLASLYRATMEPDAWQRILARLVPLFGCKAGAWAHLDRVHPHDSTVLVHGTAEENLPVTQWRDLSEDPVWRQLLARPAGQVLRSTDLVPADELAVNPLYRRITLSDRTQYGLLAVLQNQPQAFVNIGVIRSDRDFSDAEVTLMRRLLPHLQIVMEIERRIALGEAARRQALASFERAGQPLVVLDRSGSAVHCNPLARAILDHADGVRLKFGRLVFDAVAVQFEFERVLRLAVAAVTDEVAPLPQVVRVPRQSGGTGLALSVISCSSNAGRAVFSDGAGAIVLIFDADSLPVLPGEPLVWLYRLTPAEVKVCEALYGGGSVKAAADHAGLTQHTIRSHLKRIYAKLGVASQGQLMQKLANLVRFVEGRGAAPGPVR